MRSTCKSYMMNVHNGHALVVCFHSNMTPGANPLHYTPNAVLPGQQTTSPLALRIRAGFSANLTFGPFWPRPIRAAKPQGHENS